MNFRTTIILLILLIGAGTFFLVATMSPEPEKAKVDPLDAERGRKLFDVKLADIRKVTIAPGDGAPAGSQPLELAKADTDWKIVRPIEWPADAGEAGSLVNAVADLRSSEMIDVTDQNRAGTGLAQPRFTIVLTDAAGKSHTLRMGTRSELGRLYVQAGDEKATASVVTDGTLSGKLAKGINPLVANLRDKQLVRVTTFDTRQVQLDLGSRKLSLVKEANAWKLTEPKQLAADTAEVSDILATITNMRAASFATEESAASGGARFEQPRAVVTISTAAPAGAATAPASMPATAPAQDKTVVVTIGQPTDISGEKAWVKVSDPPSVAIVNLSGTSLEKIELATSLSLRDRKILDIDPESASQITLATETTSTTQPAQKQTVTLERRKENLELGPQLPKGDGGAATKPASPATAPATKPATAFPAGAKAAMSVLDRVVTMLNPTALLQDEGAPATKPAVTTAPTTPAAPMTKPSAEAAKPPADQTATRPGPAATRPAATSPSAPTPPDAAAPAIPEPPAKPPTTWVVASAGKADANDPAISSLLFALHPLRATKFLEAMPAATQPSGTQPATRPAATVYVLTVKSVQAGGKAATHELRITDRGEGAPIGQYQDLIFELERSFVDKLKADFADASGASAPNPADDGPPGFPPGMPPGFPGLPPQ